MKIGKGWCKNMLNNNILWISLLVILIVLKLIDAGAERYKNILIKRKEEDIVNRIDKLREKLYSFYQNINNKNTYSIDDNILLNFAIKNLLKEIDEISKLKLLYNYEKVYLNDVRELLIELDNIYKKELPFYNKVEYIKGDIYDL